MVFNHEIKEVGLYSLIDSFVMLQFKEFTLQRRLIQLIETLHIQLKNMEMRPDTLYKL